MTKSSSKNLLGEKMFRFRGWPLLHPWSLILPSFTENFHGTKSVFKEPAGSEAVLLSLPKGDFLKVPIDPFS